MSLPGLSVVVPNYNHAKFLPTCLDAIFQQSVAPVEVIVVEDASTDNSLEVLNEYARKYPNLRLYRNERNRGVIYNVNLGTDVSKADYIFLTAADDVVRPGLFEHSLRLLAQHPSAGLSCTVCEWRYADSGVSFYMGVGMAEQPSYLPPDEVVRVGRRGKLKISSSSVIFRKEALMGVGKCIPELRWHCDWFCAYAAALRYGLCVVPEPLSLVNIHPKSYYTHGSKQPEHLEVLRRMAELFTSPRFADILPRVRDSGVLSMFATPMLKILLSRREFRQFVNWPFLRWMVWRNAELLGRDMLPRSVKQWILNRFYGLRTSPETPAR